MRIDINIRDLSKSESLEQFLHDKIGSTLESFLGADKNGHATIHVEMSRHRTELRKPSYLCEVVVKPSYQKNTIKVSKTGDEVHAVVSAVALALKTILRRRSTKKAQHRRHEHSRERDDLIIAS